MMRKDDAMSEQKKPGPGGSGAEGKRVVFNVAQPNPDAVQNRATTNQGAPLPPGLRQPPPPPPAPRQGKAKPGH